MLILLLIIQLKTLSAEKIFIAIFKLERKQWKPPARKEKQGWQRRLCVRPRSREAGNSTNI
jgi:hypothetical protein